MKKTMTLITLVLLLTWGPLAIAGTSHQGHGDMSESHSGTMEHGAKGDMFSHQDVVEGVRAEFQVMSLASMNMKDQNGATHHIMVKLFHGSKNAQIKEAIGKIKIVGPDNAEQIDSLKNYNGIFAANFTFNKTGKYGVICLVKVGGEKHLFKFWYPHG